MRNILGISENPKTNEFTNRVFFRNGSFELIEGDIKPYLGKEKGFTVWGELIKFVDLLSAYYEAFYTIKHGLRNEELERAMEGLRKEIKDNPINGLFEELQLIP